MWSSLPPSRPTRRSVLTGGLATLGLALTGCSVRLDVDPRAPELTSTEEVRNTVAGILSTCTPGTADDPATPVDLGKLGTGGTVLETLRTAVGEVWAAPSGAVGATASPTFETHDFASGMRAVVSAVDESFTDLAPGQTAALADVELGALLSLRELGDDTVADTASAWETLSLDTLARVEESGGETSSASAGNLTPIDASDVNAWVAALYQSRYGYQQVAVLFPTDSAFGASARDRRDELARRIEAANTMLNALGEPALPDEPAWDLPVEATDAASGTELARALEDVLAAAALPLFRAEPTAALARPALWSSAVARRAAGGPQVLRYTISRDGTTTTPTAGSDTATPTPDGAAS